MKRYIPIEAFGELPADSETGVEGAGDGGWLPAPRAAAPPQAPDSAPEEPQRYPPALRADTVAYRHGGINE